MTQALGPDGVSAPAQYGPGITSLAVYALVRMYMPSARTTALAADAFAANLSDDNAYAALERAARRLVLFAERITALLQQAPVAHFDESGIRVATSLHWVHVTCTTDLICYTAHPKRGKTAMDAAGVLPHFTGTAVTDAWTRTRPALPRRRRSATPTCCVTSTVFIPPTRRRRSGRRPPPTHSPTLSPPATRPARAANSPCPPRRSPPSRNGSTRPSKPAGPSTPTRHPAGGKPFARQLADRMVRRRDDFLRFLHDLTVTFINNQAEQDIRMTKVQAKISGGWSTLTGASRWLLVRSYLSTARKHDLNPLTVLRDLFAGKPLDATGSCVINDLSSHVLRTPPRLNLVRWASSMTSLPRSARQLPCPGRP